MLMKFRHSWLMEGDSVIECINMYIAKTRDKNMFVHIEIW